MSTISKKFVFFWSLAHPALQVGLKPPVVHTHKVCRLFVFWNPIAPTTEEIALKIISTAQISNKFSHESPYISKTFSRESPKFQVFT